MLLAIFALTFGLRVLYAVTVGGDPDQNLLIETYDYRVAERIHSNLAWLGEPFTPNAPGYILSLAAVMAILTTSVWVALLCQATLAGLTALLLYRIGERQLGGGVGLLAAVWFALYVHNMHFTGILVRDMLVVLLWIWLIRVISKPFSEMRAAVRAGVLYTALVHTEPMFLLLFPAIVAAFLFFATNKRILNLQYTLVFAITLIALFVPWTVRNYFVYREPIPVAMEATRYTRPFTRVLTGDEGAAENLVSTGVRRGRMGVEHSAMEFWRVVRTADHPGDPERGIPPEPAWSTRHNVISVINYGLLLPFMLVGAVIGFRRRESGAIVVTVSLALYVLLRLFVGADERARLPAEPLIILLAFYGVMQLVERRRGHDEGERIEG